MYVVRTPRISNMGVWGVMYAVRTPGSNMDVWGVMYAVRTPRI